MIRQLILALVVLVTVQSVGFSQTQQAPSPSATQTPAATPADDRDDVVRITTNLVQVDAVVLKDGKPVRDLKAEDFELYEDGRKQVITSFTYISNVSRGDLKPQPTVPNGAPGPRGPLQPHVPRRTIALVIDDLGLSAESMSHVRKQLKKFITEQVEPNDLLAVIRTGGTMGALQQFTVDRRITDRAVDQLKWNLCSRVGIHVLPPVGPNRFPTMNSLYGPCGATASVGETLRALRFVVEAMSELPGRKSMIVFSDSLPREEQEIDFNSDRRFTTGDSESDPNALRPAELNYHAMLLKIAEKAIRSSVVIYSIDAGGLQYTGPTAADQITGSSRQMNDQINNLMLSRSRLLWDRREGAELIAKETGGFLVRNSNDFQLNRIVEEESGYYLLGYRPDEETFNKHFHHIKAKVKRSGMSLRTRNGFYGITEDEANQLKRTPDDQATIALMSPFGKQEVGLDLTAFFANESDKGSFVRSFVYLNAKDLTFSEDVDGWHSATIRFRGIVFGDNGIIVNQVTHDRTVRLRDQTFDDALRNGFSVQFDIPVTKPGSYQMRVAAHDIASGRIGSMGQTVVIPDLRNHALAISGIVMRGETDSSSSTQVNAGAGPAVRNFFVGQNVYFSCVIYNAMLNASKQPNVTLQAKLFRDAKEVYTSPVMNVSMDNQSDLTRLIATGFVHLVPPLQPGSYYLQISVTDQLREKQPPVTQWIDFEIVK